MSSTFVEDVPGSMTGQSVSTLAEDMMESMIGGAGRLYARRGHAERPILKNSLSSALNKIMPGAAVEISLKMALSRSVPRATTIIAPNRGHAERLHGG